LAHRVYRSAANGGLSLVNAFRKLVCDLSLVARQRADLWRAELDAENSEIDGLSSVA
jgi:hypothetical protein